MDLIRDKKQTLAQNYKRLGLVSRLNKRSGGIEKSISSITAAISKPAASSIKLAPGEARIERDGDGNVVNVVYGKSAEETLNDDEVEEEEEEESKSTDIVKALEEQASFATKTERLQSEREKEWVELLVQKYGRDYSKMVRDRKLNPYQQTEGDVKRRIAKWEKAQKKGDELVTE